MSAPRKFGAAGWILTALVVLLVLGGAAIGGLWAVSVSDSNRRIADNHARTLELRKRVDDLTSEVRTTQDLVATAQLRLLAAAEKRSASQACVDAVQAFWDASAAGDVTAGLAAFATFESACGTRISL